MEKNGKENLKIVHIASDPEFLSPIVYKNYHVDIETMDNPFAVSQWVIANGLPDAIICETNLPGGNGFGFYNFWIEQFDSKKNIPFVLLADVSTQDTISKAHENKIEDVYFKPTTAETIIDKILTYRQSQTLNDKSTVAEMNAFRPYKYTFLKRTFDIVTATILLLIISPVLLIFAIAIQLESSGKVFYTSKRVGSGYRVFDFYKLRSMYTKTDRRLKKLALLNESTKEISDGHHETANPFHWNNSTVAGDPRITKVGRIMRKLNIDEFPQLYNVIKGDISIVGNRPLPIYEAELLTIDDWSNRIHSPAGITGIWKVVSRRKLRSMTHEERNSLQNKYSQVANSSTSFWKDIWIIIQTVPASFRKENV